MKSYTVSFVAAALFAVAAILTLINGSMFRAAIGTIAAVSFLLAGIHYRKKERGMDQNNP